MCERFLRKCVSLISGATALLLLAWGIPESALATPVALGYLSFDVTSGTTAAFDIVNLTGPNSFPPDYPVLTPVSFSDLELVVTFSDTSTTTFGASDFTLSLDGLSFDGPTVAYGGSVLPVGAVLTGELAPTTIDIGTPVDVESSFLPTLLAAPAGAVLSDGDAAAIFVDTAPTGGGTVPEPGSLALALLALAGLGIGCARRQRCARAGAPRRATAAAIAGIAAAALPLWAAGATTAVKLATAASPSTGVAGVSFVNLTARGLPSGTAAADIHVAIAPTCAVGGSVAGEVDTVATSLKSLPGSLQRIQFQIPGALAQGTYFVSVSGSASGTPFASGGCSIVSVTASNVTLNACLPTSSLAVALGPTVTAYVPNGWWGGGATGVQSVPVEGGGAPASIPTADLVNSCSSNPATGLTVCTANTKSVYLISGSSLVNTLTSGANSSAGFSGGYCQNCGVAINALTNTAYLEVGLLGSPSSSGVQALSLDTNAFGTPFATTHVVSENISVDPGRGLILTPGEWNSYDLLQLNSAGAITAEFVNSSIPAGGGEFDSAAEDCTTGIALAADEFTSNIVLTDLNQATFTPGSPGTWSAPSTLFNMPGTYFSAGTSGISVAPGGSHLGIVTGEFGGQSFAVFQLPSAPATGGAAPTIVDYVFVPTLPSTPDGYSFSAGYDPHTTTAYTSPNDGKPYGIIADWVTGVPTYLAVFDLQKLMAAPRQAGTHTIDSAFDLLASGALRYVPTH